MKPETRILLDILERIPAMRAQYERRGIGPDICLDTLYDLARWAGVCRQQTGVTGVRRSEADWFERHLRAELFELGRLQFAFGRFPHPVLAFLNAEGQRAVVMDRGARLRQDGLIDGTDGVFDQNAVETVFARGEGQIFGHLVRNARADARPSSLEGEWRCVLKPGDPVLEVHIPAGEKMELDACLSSFERADAFFPKHFPELEYRAFTCESWLLGEPLGGILPEGSNILRFASLFTRYPARSGRGAFIFRVFGCDAYDSGTAPRLTSLQRGVARILDGGGQLYGGAGFILRGE